MNIKQNSCIFNRKGIFKNISLNFLPAKALLFLSLIIISATAYSQTTFVAGDLKISLNKTGFCTELTNKTTGKNYLYADTTAPLMTIVSNGVRLLPTSMAYNKSTQKISLVYEQAGIKIDIGIKQKATQLVLEVVNATPQDKIDAVVWGPFPTSVNNKVGEIIGVVRDSEISIGLQVLNVKTLGGGFPNNEGSTWARGIAAVARPWGSYLQAYSINRSSNRFVDAWGGIYKNMPVPAIKGESIVGSKIALFSCAEPVTLNRLEKIELDEQLPHPTFKGIWFKKSPLYGRSYLISSFGQTDIDEMIGYTKRAGLISLYHEGPFKSWGHFVLDEKDFPNGRKGFKDCVDKAHAAGLLFGFHTLTNFINTNDPYVTPIPDDRLSVTGTSTLVKNIDATQTEIEIVSPEYFNQQDGNNLHTIKIDKELIRYKLVTNTAPYKLTDCQRGAFGTTASAHEEKSVAGKLFDHSYKVFFPNFAMQHEVAQNLATFMNETGADHFDFDGQEGGIATGEGDYGAEMFSKDVYDNVKHDFIAGTSRSSTFFWHIGSYYNWGEPWYGGFKESMQQYRIDNQGLFDRNYMPHMLGWYLLTESTTLTDMEWMLARAAAYDAGFAMVASPKALRNNPHTTELLDAIREWETARTGNAFTKKLQENLKNTKNEFHLQAISEGKWKLYEFATSPLFTHENIQKQPGEPQTSTWQFHQDWTTQPLQFQLKITGNDGAVINIKIHIDNYTELIIPLQLAAGQTVVCDGSATIIIYDKLGNQNSKLTDFAPLPVLAPGDHTIMIECGFVSNSTPRLEMKIKGLQSEEMIILKSSKKTLP